jgi:riboflavin synthase
MFTGIVREQGVVVRTRRAGGLLTITIQAPKTVAAAEVGESVSIGGVCLSVVAVRRGTLSVEAIGETQRCTTLGRLRPGARVNLERSLRLTDRLSGHVVLGHVDGVGTIVKRAQRAGELVLTVRSPSSLRRWLVPKGPIAVDGVSLTVGPSLTASTLTVHLIPETLRQTTLTALKVGDEVNLELDYLAKLMLGRRSAAQRGKRMLSSSRAKAGW